MEWERTYGIACWGLKLYPSMQQCSATRVPHKWQEGTVRPKIEKSSLRNFKMATCRHGCYPELTTTSKRSFLTNIGYLYVPWVCSPPTTPPTKHDNHVPPESPIRIRFASIQPGEVKFCKTPFNIIDFVALLAAVVELFSLNLPVDPTLLRLCRLAKLFRKGGWFQGEKHEAVEAAKWTQMGSVFWQWNYSWICKEFYSIL